LSSTRRHLRRIESIVPRRARPFGGKARNLAALARAGFPVPAAYALSGDICREFLEDALPPEDRLETLLKRGSRANADRLALIGERVRSTPLPRHLASELTRALETLQRAGARSVAVRSSSNREDEDAASAAGLHDTFLDIRTPDELHDAVRAVWASLFQARVLSYLRTFLQTEDASMGVVIQAMVPADVSGVVFTVNPLTGDAGEMVVNAAWGLGSTVVDGRVSPDTYRVDKATGGLRDRVLGTKGHRDVVAEEGGVRAEAVPEELHTSPALSEALLADLVALGTRIEEQFGSAQDVEFAIAAGTIYVLQSRPVSTVSPGFSARRSRKKGVDRGRIVWSNANVGEALPGVATPLTWSVLSNFSELGFRRAFGAVGCSVPRDAELFGNFRGRIYLNLSEFTSIASQVPGLKPRTLLSLGGGGEVDRLEADLDARSSFGFFLRLPLTASRFARENYRLSSAIADFEEAFERERADFRAIDLRILSPAALGKTLGDVEQLLDHAGAVMLTCYGNLLLSVVTLRAVLRVVSHRHAERIERSLLTGLADVESAAPGLALWHIAGMARSEPDAKAFILGNAPGSVRVADLPEGPTRRALSNFISAFGFRSAREAEIATPRWREDPTLLFAILRAHLGADGTERPVDAERRQRKVRDAAAAELDRLLPGPAAVAARHLLSLVQRFMRLRERLRAHVTEILGMFREVALDASRRLLARDRNIGKDAAFFLTLEELHAVLKGDQRSLSALVRQRRRQYERDSALPDPPDTFVGYPPEAPGPLPDTDALTGLAASSGRVRGRARVLASPAEAGALEVGEILVAPYADVGWSPLFTVAGAVVTDLGGPLSHASIVAREYGVPSVVNVKLGTRLIHTGDLVEVDGDAGTVRILEASADVGANADGDAALP